MGECIKFGRGIWSPIRPVFADTSWMNIIAACQSKKVPSTWNVGDQKVMTIGDTDYIIDIIGKNHDTYADGSGKAPLTLQLHDVYKTAYKMNNTQTNSGGWNGCIMRSEAMPTILALMPSDIQAGIKEVSKKTTTGDYSTTIGTTADKLFLLSEIEIHGSVTYSIAGEGEQYAYYSGGGSKIKYLGTTAKACWTRSPVNSSVQSKMFCYVSSSGAASRSNSTLSFSVAPAFCF
jgi:hypothetical protein